MQLQRKNINPLELDFFYHVATLKIQSKMLGTFVWDNHNHLVYGNGWRTILDGENNSSSHDQRVAYYPGKGRGWDNTGENRYEQGNTVQGVNVTGSGRHSPSHITWTSEGDRSDHLQPQFCDITSGDCFVFLGGTERFIFDDWVKFILDANDMGFFPSFKNRF